MGFLLYLEKCLRVAGKEDKLIGNRFSADVCTRLLETGELKVSDPFILRMS